MENEAELNTKNQLLKTVKSAYNRWNYEIDAEYERKFIAYLIANQDKNFISLESIKNDLPDCYKHLHSFTANGTYKGWKYEIDVDNEREFLSYLSIHWNDSIIGPGSPKEGAPKAFKHLHSLNVPEHVRSIESYAFADCPKLEIIRCPGCELISKQAFRNCEQLIFGFFPKAKVVQSFSFFRAGIDSPVFTLYTPEVNSIESNSFVRCGAQVLYFPSLSNMVCRTIVECPRLEQVSIENTLTIEAGAIQGNKKLDAIYSPRLKHVNYAQVDNWKDLTYFIVSQQAKQILVRKAEEDEEVPACFLTLSEYQRTGNNGTTIKH